MSRRRPRQDANQAVIVAALRSMGWYVLDTSGLGAGFPDLVIARAGRLVLVEVKDGNKPPSERKLTPAEARVHRDFAATGVTVQIVTSVDDALQLSRAWTPGQSYDDRQIAGALAPCPRCGSEYYRSSSGLCVQCLKKAAR